MSRYANSPAVGMWEPISEAEASSCPPRYQPTNCSGHQICPRESVAASALRYFFDTVGAEIHALDPNHLVESGLLGGGQCGTEGPDYQYVSASPGIDVLSYHDYWGITPYGGTKANGVLAHLQQSTSLDKPIIAGEVGIEAGPGCLSVAARALDMATKVKGLIQSGGAGSLVWNWVPVPTPTCSYDVGPFDPLLQSGGLAAALSTFTTRLPAQSPEVPVPFFLPVAAMLIGGGYVLHVRRRKVGPDRRGGPTVH